jgi:hypothetical protein
MASHHAIIGVRVKDQAGHWHSGTSSLSSTLIDACSLGVGYGMQAREMAFS